MRKRKLRNTRPKALFGEVAAAGITAAATLAAAGIGAAATAKAAKEQSNATIQQAKQQAAAIEATNTNNNQLQQQSQQFIAQENEANRQIQRDLQLSLQMQAGGLDSEQRRAASRIQVKKGGKVKSRKKLRDIYHSSLRGNLPFEVTDGGNVIPVGITPEGYDLYEIVGNDHNHYHKTRGGKYKSGVGIKFANGETVEGEGNQNGSQGEYLVVTPDEGMFISKHSINGFNPAQAINQGMHPLAAYQMQETSKSSSPVRKNRYMALAGASTNFILPTDYPMNDLGFDMSGANIVLGRRSMKRGGRCKALYGSPYIMGPETWTRYNMSYPMDNSAYSLGVTSIGNGSKNTKRNRWYDNISGNIWGAGITTLGNIGGALLSNWGASRASRALNNAYLESGKILGDAYANLKTVDMSNLSRDTFRHQHYMPVVRSSNYNVNNQLGTVDRTGRASIKAVNNNTLSSAARLSRMSGINDAVIAAKSKIYEDKYNKEEAVKQKNIDAINEAARQNVLMDVEANKDFARTYVDLLKYNNDIVNESITGRAQAMADAIMGGVGARANYMQVAGQNWGNAISTSAKGFGNAISTDYTQNRQLAIERTGGAFADQVRNVILYGTDSDKANYKAVIQNILSNPRLTDAQRSQYEVLFGMFG